MSKRPKKQSAKRAKRKRLVYQRWATKTFTTEGEPILTFDFFNLKEYADEYAEMASKRTGREHVVVPVEVREIAPKRNTVKRG